MSRAPRWCRSRRFAQRLCQCHRCPSRSRTPPVHFATPCRINGDGLDLAAADLANPIARRNVPQLLILFPLLPRCGVRRTEAAGAEEPHSLVEGSRARREPLRCCVGIEESDVLVGKADADLHTPSIPSVAPSSYSPTTEGAAKSDGWCASSAEEDLHSVVGHRPQQSPALEHRHVLPGNTEPRPLRGRGSVHVLFGGANGTMFEPLLGPETP